eukprot:11193002-Karenia_brevis.AAC.1
MRLFVRSIQEERNESKTVVEEVPKGSNGSKGSNGVVGRAVQEIEGRTRSLLLSLEERSDREIDATERIVALIPQYAAYQNNSLHRGDD